MEVKPTADLEANVPPTIPDDARSLLVLASPLEEQTAAICGDLLSTDDASTTNYLSVALDETPHDRLDHWRRHATPALPAKVGIVACGETTRAATATSDTGTTRYAGSDVRVTGVSSPGDLTGLGIAVERCLSAWDGDEHRTVACIDSLTTLLQYVDVRRAFRFLNVLLARFAFVDAVVHAHVDPDAHDAKTLATIESLFDAVIERDDEEWQLR